MNLKRFLAFEWDAIAGILAAVIALILHTLHVVETDILQSIILVLLALLFIGFVRHERNDERMAERVERTESAVMNIQAALSPPDVILIGPRYAPRANGLTTARMAKWSFSMFAC